MWRGIVIPDSLFWSCRLEGGFGFGGFLNFFFEARASFLLMSKSLTVGAMILHVLVVQGYQCFTSIGKVNHCLLDQRLEVIKKHLNFCTLVGDIHVHNFTKVFSYGFKQCMLPVVLWETLKFDPKRNLWREWLGNDKFPLLKNNHPLVIVIWFVIKKFLHVVLIVKTELKTSSSQIWPSCFTFQVPAVGEKRKEGPKSLDCMISQSSHKGEGFSFNELRGVYLKSSNPSSSKRWVSSINAFSFEMIWDSFFHGSKGYRLQEVRAWGLVSHMWARVFQGCNSWKVKQD